VTRRKRTVGEISNYSLDNIIVCHVLAYSFKKLLIYKILLLWHKIRDSIKKDVQE